MNQLIRLVNAPGDLDLKIVLRHVLFVAILLLFWVSLNPFNDLTSTRVIDTNREADPVKPIAYVLLGSLCLLIIPWLGLRNFLPLWRPTWIVLLGLMGTSVLFSQSFGTSFPRAVLGGIVIIAAAVALLLPTGERAFRLMLAACAILVVALSYLGVIAMPEQAIHTRMDVFEPFHDGAWRGVFPHKNTAGPIIGAFVFVGVYLARTGNALTGLVLVVASAFFVLMTDSKTPIGTVPVVLLASAIVAFFSARWIVVTVLMTPFVLGLALALMVGLTPGLIKPLLSVLPDPTFTGRTEIWEFLVGQIAQKPLFGYGFAAFWRTDGLIGSELYGDGQWVAHAFHAHNGFYELAVTMGVPAAIIGLVALVILPLKDYLTAREIPGQRPLTTLFMQMWLFGALNACFESFFLTENPVWFTFLIAVLGLRFLSMQRAES
jgi:O-antigen ligase